MKLQSPFGPGVPRVYTTSKKAAAAPPERPAAAPGTDELPGAPKIDRRKRNPRDYNARQIARAAYMAASGATAQEIADEIGAGTAAKVYGLLHRIGINLTPRHPGQEAMLIRVDKAAMAAVGEQAAEHGLAAPTLAARLLREICDEPALLRSLAIDAAHASGEIELQLGKQRRNNSASSPKTPIPFAADQSRPPTDANALAT